MELIVNGKSQGRKKRNSQDFPAAGLHWNVVLNEGDNSIEAIAYDGKMRLSDAIHQTYQTAVWGEPAEIRLTQIALTADTVLIQAELVDNNGVHCLDASNFIEFECTGRHALIQNQGTAHGSRRIQAANGLAAIRVKRGDMPVVVGARSGKCRLRSTVVVKEE